jgi:hypothetical protein
VSTCLYLLSSAFQCRNIPYSKELAGCQHGCWRTVCCICATGQALSSQSLFHSGRLCLFCYQPCFREVSVACVLLCNQSTRYAWCVFMQTPKVLRSSPVTLVQG